MRVPKKSNYRSKPGREIRSDCWTRYPSTKVDLSAVEKEKERRQSSRAEKWEENLTCEKAEQKGLIESDTDQG